MTPWTVACRAPLFIRLSRPADWSGLPFPPSGALPDPGIKPTSLASPALAGRFFATVSPNGETLPWRTACDDGGRGQGDAAEAKEQQRLPDKPEE